MKINAFELRIKTAEGLFGSRCTFTKGLNIIRGDNSSGKSTFVNSLVYGIGLEELLGGRNLTSLTSAVTDRFKYEGRDIAIQHSETLVELENNRGEVITVRRPIRADKTDPKLVSIVFGPQLTAPNETYTSADKYLHDKGSAHGSEGYHALLSDFLGWNLPSIINNDGTAAPLYLQTVFSATIVEQKRGWSDYLANLPYYNIRNNKTKVIEFLLNLAVFDNELTVSRLNAASVEIHSRWGKNLAKLEAECRRVGGNFYGVPSSPSAKFDAKNARLSMMSDNSNIEMDQYVLKLRRELSEFETPSEATQDDSQLSVSLSHLQKVTLRFESVSARLSVQRSALEEVKRLNAETEGELARNKAVRKLAQLGSEQTLATAADKCPTCLQALNGSLLTSQVFGPQMNLEENIRYQENQLQMLQRQQGALEGEVQRLELEEASGNRHVTQLKNHIADLRQDLRSTLTESRAAIRQQMLLEDSLRDAIALEELFKLSMQDLVLLAAEQAANARARQDLPKQQYSPSDLEKIRLFERFFRANASSFDYQSVEIGHIKIGLGNLLPHLEDMELRSVFSRLRADSSASDFIRLIWSYDLALYQTSARPEVRGNHPGFLLFDEPAQHSMAESALRSLFLQLAGERNLQSIVAASFEESDHAFNQATNNLNFHLIRIDQASRSIGPGPQLLDA